MKKKNKTKKNTIEKTTASAGTIPTLEVNVEEEKYTKMKNEMAFFLVANPECHICAAGEWYENAEGEVVGEVDTYFYNLRTGRRCDCVWSCLNGWHVPDKKTAEGWETLCFRIGELQQLKKIICTEKSVRIFEKKQ